MAWAGIYSGSAFQLRLRSRALHFPETSYWQWRGQQHSVSTVLIIMGPPFIVRGVGVKFLSRGNYLFQPGSAAR